MNLVNRAVRNFGAMRRAAGEWGDSSIPPNSLLGVTGSGTIVNESGALAISTVLNCVKVLHNDLGILPFVAYSGDRRGQRKPLDQQPAIVTDPFGPDLPIAAGMGQIVVSYAMRGNAFLFVTAFDSLGFPTQVQVLHPDRVQVRVIDGLKKFRIGTETYGPDQVKHITGLMLPGSVEGIDPISYQRVTLGLAGDVNQYGANFFKNGGFPNLVIEAKGLGNRKRAREIQAAWEAGHGGVANAHRPAVIFGDSQVKPIVGIAPENAQFLQTRAFLREEVCGWFGVPLQRIQAITDNASQGGGKGVDAIDHGYVTHTLLAITTAIESVWNQMVPGAQQTWCHFDFDGFLRAAAKERAEIAQMHRVAAVRNPDEIRADEGWQPIPDGRGQDYFTPLNSNASPTGGADNQPGPGPDSQGSA